MAAKYVRQVACYLKPAQHDALKKLSAATGAPVQHYLRLAVDELLKRRRKKARRVRPGS
jgi:hypothetical protein